MHGAHNLALIKFDQITRASAENFPKSYQISQMTQTFLGQQNSPSIFFTSGYDAVIR